MADLSDIILSSPPRVFLRGALACLLFVISLPWTCRALASEAERDPLAASLILLANADQPESLVIARHYAERRGVPAENIVALPMSQRESMSWQEFSTQIWEPLSAWLLKGHWIDGVLMEARDAAGRRKYSVNSHRISFLVVCKGVPLRIQHEAALRDQALPVSMAREPALQTTAAAVDSELATLAYPGRTMVSFVPNPLYANENPSRWDSAQVIKVSRLDGPDFHRVLSLVDLAMQAEREGLVGRAYIDCGGPYPDGDRWFTLAERMLEEAGMDLSVDRGPGLFPDKARFDRPILYLGWYASDCAGRLADPSFSFPPGAIAYHLHSFSAPTLRDASKGWVGPLIAHGATATFGNVNEPYLALCQKPQMLVHALLRGERLGDAAYFSLPGLSWQNLVIGDPLYRPFARSFESQWEQRKSLDPARLGYLVIRRMRLLELQNKAEQALALGLGEYRESPSLPLALALAPRLMQRERRNEAMGVLDTVLRNQSARDLDEACLHLEAARFLQQNGAPIRAIEVLKKLSRKGAYSENFQREVQALLLDLGA